MTEDEYDATIEGRATITATCVDAAKIMREQIEASEFLRRDTEQARLDRYAMAFGALLAHVPVAAKAELIALVRYGDSTGRCDHGVPLVERCEGCGVRIL